MKLKSYLKYKESGIQWIGLIPKKWEIVPVRGVCKLGRGRVISNQEIEENQGKYPVFSSQTSNNGEMGKIDTYDFDGEYVTWTTDGANAGTTFYRNGKFNCTNVCGTLKRKNNKIHMKLLPYILNKISEYHVRYDINPKLMNDMMARIKIPLPMLNNQIIISKFLDKKTAEISKLIEKDKKLIELLKEKRTALINHAVTKGLDPNVKMKDSGIEWIGKIPEGWEVKKLKFLLCKKAQYGANSEPETNENKQDIRYVRITDIDNLGNLREDSLAYLSKEDARGFELKEGDILFARSGATVGKVYYYTNKDGKCCYAGYLIKYVSNKTLLNSKFLYYFSLSKSYSEWIKSILIQSTIENVSAEKYSNLILSVPLLSEQTSIAQHLDKNTARIDKRIQKIQKKIELLEEYKKSLIHHAVTGKIDVRGSEI